MINKDSKISLTYELGGEYLTRSGKYTTADITVKHPFTKSEEFYINKRSQTIEPAFYSKAVQMVTLNNEFVKNCFSAPAKPRDMNFHAWLRTPLGRISQKWKKMSIKEKIEFHLEQYVLDMGGINFSYKIL